MLSCDSKHPKEREVEHAEPFGALVDLPEGSAWSRNSEWSSSDRQLRRIVNLAESGEVNEGFSVRTMVPSLNLGARMGYEVAKLDMLVGEMLKQFREIRT